MPVTEVSEMAAGRDLRYPARSLVLVTGLPGAGKSTLLHRLYRLTGEETGPVAVEQGLVIDAVQARNWWGSRLGVVPQRLLLPLVYTTHVWRIARALLGGHAVVAPNRGTWSQQMYGFAWLTARLGAELHVVMLDVAPDVARAGQISRGRVLMEGTFARHCRKWQALVERARKEGRLAPAVSVAILDRSSADLVRAIRFDR